MLKHLVTHGNSKALVIDKALLSAAGLNENTPFLFTVNHNGLTIQSVSDEATFEEFKKVADKILHKRSKLWERLANK